ncbi:hypothetical protein [Acidovorax radicis]|uniref:hypothetical protein n=1 Tax=Acidovorax radicis TaxID=758826 RepID=UPI001CF8047F|nr:hypothetical protein [Acidovorax radicis]UCU98130.1 pilus assembly protein [Acidovorax radicis]
MRKMTIVKIAAAVLFALWLFFGDGKTSHRFVVLVAVFVGYQVFSRVKAQHAVQEGARLGMSAVLTQRFMHRQSAQHVRYGRSLPKKRVRSLQKPIGDKSCTQRSSSTPESRAWPSAPWD